MTVPPDEEIGEYKDYGYMQEMMEYGFPEGNFGSLDTDALQLTEDRSDTYTDADLQTLIDSVGADSTLRPPPGVYEIDSAPQLPDGITLKGGKGSVVLKAADGTNANLLEGASTNPIDIEITGVTFDLNRLNVSRTGEEDNLGILLDKPAGCYIHHNWFKHGLNSGVYAKGIHNSTQYSRSVLVSNNIFYDFTGVPSPACAWFEGANEYSAFKNNKAVDCNIGVHWEAGNHEVIGNQIAFAQQGIEGRGTGRDNPGKTDVKNNKINHVTIGAAIDLEDCPHMTMVGNTGFSINEEFMLLDGVRESLIAANHCGAVGKASDSTFDAIFIRDGTDLNSTQNAIYANTPQWYIDSGGNNARTGINEVNGVSGNVIRLNSTVANNGFSLNSTAASLNDTF